MIFTLQQAYLHDGERNKMDKRVRDQYRVIEFGEFGDERGNLVVAECGGVDVPFDVKRVFYIYGSDDTVIRGRHANRKSQFVLINVAGSSKVKVDNGFESEIVVLDRPRMGLYLPTMLWKDMYDFSEDSVLLVLASEHYDGNEYIRNYDDFLKEVGGVRHE